MTADVLVIGGGFAGLTAARDLTAAGRSVVVLEARPRLGGRTWYRPFADTDVEVEIGGAWFSLARQPQLAEEVDRYGVSVVPVPDRRRRRWFTGGMRRRGRPVPKREAETLRAVLRGMVTAPPPAGVEEDVSVSEWMRSASVPRATRDFVLAWAAFMSGAGLDEVSMLEVLALVAEGDGSPGSLTDEIGERFEGGTAALLNAIAEDSGAEIRLGSPVARLAQENDRVTVTLAEGANVDAEAAVLAVPLNTLDALELDPPIDETQARVAAQGHPGQSRKIWLLADGALDGLVCIGYGTPFNWLSCEGRLGDASLLVGFACEDVSDPEAAVAAYAPGAKILAADSHDWVADPWSRGTWLASRPGWTTTNALAGFASPHGRVVFAGSDYAEEHAGWIAGAIASGRAAARRVITGLAAPVG